MRRFAVVPRSLDAAEARAHAPSTNETPDGDAILLATLTDAVRALQETVMEMEGQIARLTRKVSDLEGGVTP